MKEKLYTIPVNEAFESGDECPFCFLERQAERSALRYVAGPGASYMEPEIRGETDRRGFCRGHMKKLHDYGNTLGSALMLQTYYAGILEEFHVEVSNFVPPEKKSIFNRKKQSSENALWLRLQQKADSCYICDKIEYNMERYFQTFFALLKEPEFRSRVEESKGFCLPHFARLLQMAEDALPNSQRQWFYDEIFPLMEANLIRVKEDLDWLIAKYDYRNAGADWKNARDALPRAMQKLESGHPSDEPYKDK